MKYFLSLCCFCCSCFFAGAQNEVIVDANAEPRTLNGSFKSVKVSGGIDLYLSQSDKEAIAVSASEDRFRQNIKTIVDNGVLKIYIEGEKIWNFIKGRKMKVYVSFKDIQKLEASGASDIRVSGTINTDSLNLHLSGASDFRGDLHLKDLTIDLNGASDVTISGKAENININCSGASDVKGSGMTTDRCNIKASGASDINITVMKELNVNLSGASNVIYEGTALINDIHTTNASKVVRKGVEKTK